MATRGIVLFETSPHTYRVFYRHYDSYPTGLGLQLIHLLKQAKTLKEVVEESHLEDYKTHIYKVEDAFLKVQGDIEWIYVIHFEENPEYSGISIYRTSNPWTKVDFVYPVWSCFVKFLPEDLESEMRYVEMTARMVLRALAAYEEASKR